MAAATPKVGSSKINGFQDKSGQPTVKKDGKKKAKKLVPVPEDIYLIDFREEPTNERACNSLNLLMEKWMDNTLELDWEDPENFPPIPGWCTLLKCAGCGLSTSDEWYLCPAGHHLCKDCYEDHFVDRKPFCPAPLITTEKGKDIVGRCSNLPLKYDWNSPLGRLRCILETKERLCCLDAGEDHKCDVIIKDALGGQEYERHFELCDFFCANGCPFKTCFQGEMTAFELVNHLLNQHKARAVENDSKNELKFEMTRTKKFGAKEKKTAVKIIEDAFCPPRATDEKARSMKLAESVMVPYMIKYDGVHFFMLIRRTEKGIQGWVSLMESNNLENVKYSATVFINSDVKQSEPGAQEEVVFVRKLEAIRRYQVPETKRHTSFTMDWKTLEDKFARKGRNNSLITNCRIFIERIG